MAAVGFDGTAESYAALDEGPLAAKFGASIRVIGVATPMPPMGAGLQPKWAPRRAGFPDAAQPRGRGAGAGARALPVFERGDPVQKLLEDAEIGVDLLVPGSRGFGPVMRLLIGSVSSRVIREAPCPVLVVPRPA